MNYPLVLIDAEDFYKFWDLKIIIYIALVYVRDYEYTGKL